MKKLVLSLLLLLSFCCVCSAQAPIAPTNLVVTNSGLGTNVALSWTDNASTETGFEIDRKLGVSGSYSQIDTVGANVTTYTDTSAKINNRPYIYRVRATNGGGDSANSNEDDAVTPFTGTRNNYRTDTSNYAETPTTMPLPLAGGKFYDETFGTQVMRFTDETDGLSFGTNYSVWPTANSDNTKLFIFNFFTNQYFIGTLDPVTFARVGSLQTVANPPATIFSHLEAFFWSFTDADKAFILVDAKIYYYRPSTNSYTLVKDLQSFFGAGWYFNQLYVSSNDNRFAALLKNGSGDQGFMVYELSSDTLKLDVRTTDMNGITMDKSGSYVLYVADTPFEQGIYNVNTGAFDELVSDPGTGLPDFQIGHNDTGTDSVVSDDQWRGGFTWRRMSAPHTVTLAWQYAPYWISHHVSGRANNELWNLVSTYGAVPVSADPNKYKREVLQIGVQTPFTGSLRRIAHTRAMWEIGGIDTVTNATNASPIVITTSAAHNLQSGQRLQMSGIGGNTAANGTFFITVLSSTTFSLNGSNGNGAYTSGGQAYLETYWDSPRCNISRDGQFVFCTSNWNGIPGGGRNDLYIFRVVPAATTNSTVTFSFGNVQHGTYTDGSNNITGQVNILGASDVDVVGANEVSVGDVSSYSGVFTGLGMSFAVYDDHPAGTGDGNAIWYRTATTTLLQTYSHDLANGPSNIGWNGQDVRRSVVAAKFSKGGRQFYTVVFHACANLCEDSSSTNFAAQRVAQIEDLLSWINSTLTGGLPVVILGDFNLPPNYPRAPERSYTADASTDVLTSAGHGWTNGVAVALRTTGSAPGGLATGDSLYAQATVYYVRDATSTTFKLAASPGGAVIDLTSSGTGSNFVSATQWDLFIQSYTDLWFNGLGNLRSTANWGDRDANGEPDQPVAFQTTRTHDSRRIDYIMAQGAMSLVSIDMPDVRAACSVALEAGGNYMHCPDVQSAQRTDFPDDQGVRPSDHNFLKAVLSFNSDSFVHCKWSTLPPCQN